MPRFRFEQFDDRGGGTIAALMMAPAQARARALREGGAARARAEEMRGQSWANAAGSIGQIISGGVQGYAQEKANAPIREMQGLQLDAAKAEAAARTAAAETQARQDAAFRDLLSRDQMPDPKEILTIYGPERGTAIARGLNAFAELAQQKVTDARDAAGRLAIGAKALSPELLGQFWPSLREAAIKGGLGDASVVPEQPDPKFLDGIIAWSKGELPEQPEGFTLSPGETRFGPDGKPIANVAPKVEAPPIGSFEDFVTQKYGPRPTPPQIASARREYGEAGRAPTINVNTGGGGGDAQGGVTAPLNPDSQDIMGHAGLSYNGFLALTNPTRLPRDQATRNKAAQEVQRWARERGMDVATFQSQFRAFNDVLEKNIERFNTVKNIEGELEGSVASLIQSAKDAGLNDARAINAAKLWLKGQLNDAQAADYGFALRALISDIARYNAASSGRAPLESDMSDARAVVQSGIATGSLKGLQAAINRSVKNMGDVLEGSVNRANKAVWDLFGVGDKYKPKGKAAPQGGGGGRVRYDENGNVIKGGD